MDHLLVEYDYYSERINPQCNAAFQARVKNLYKEYRIHIICQIRVRVDNKKIKAQLWILDTASQPWFQDMEMREIISQRLVDKFKFSVDNY